MSTPRSSVRPHSQLSIQSNTPIRSIREQSETDNLSQISSATSIDDLPRVTIGDRSFILENYLHTKRPRHSWVWEHGIALVEQPKQDVQWCCKLCDEAHHPQLYSAHTTSNAERHLKRKHGLKKLEGDDESDDEEASQNSQSRIDEMLAQVNKRSKTADSHQPKGMIERFKDALLAWIIHYQIAFLAIENSFFKDLITILSPQLAALLPSGNTIRAWILTKYELQKANLKTQLRKNSLSMIHISFDLWTSSNSKALMAVVAHYTDRQYKIQTQLLALRRLHGHHRGENQAELLIQIIKEYEITDRLGYFVTDNANNNDTTINIVLHTLLPALSIAERQQRRLRCWGHILNLAARAFLFGQNAEDFDEQILIHRTLAREQAELQEWRKRGPIGKLHNIVVFIRRSPQRRETFLELADAGDEFSDLMLVQDNATRWNSAYLMIERAIQKRTSVDRFIENSIYETDKNKIVPVEDRLTNQDWLVLTETCNILRPFYYQTKRFQSRATDGTHGAIWEAYPSCEFLLQHILAKKREYEYDHAPLEPAASDQVVTESRKHLKTSIDNCWGKLDEYYKKLDALPIYVAALVLNPGQKLAYIERQWAGKRTWIDNAKKEAKKQWESGWKGRHTPSISDALPTVEAGATHASTREPDDFDQFMNPPNFYATQQAVQVDEYKEYLKIPAAHCEKPLTWWQARHTEWPSLAAMAFDVLSIPLMSAECERVFSAAGYLINSRRSKMKEDIIEATTCLRAWQSVD
jgi:hypothetical protein